MSHPKYSARTRALLTVMAAGAAVFCASRAIAAETFRVATFNLALYGAAPGEILARLESGEDPQVRALAEIIQRVRPDVLVLNEIDYDPEGAVLDAFAKNYLAVGQNVSQSPAGPAEPIEFSHRMAFASNTGEHSGLDLDRNGQVAATPGDRAYGSDCWGYGVYTGQYAFGVLSRFPIDAAAVREFRKFLWKDMPGAQLPDDPATASPGDWYAPEILARFRLSSKNHCDVPIVVDGRRIHLLLCHPTPPVFDGAEDRNGHRNHDELRFWADYISPIDLAPSPSVGRAGEGGEAGARSASNSSSPTSSPTPLHQGEGSGSYLYDDAGRHGGLPAGSSFLIIGDLNGDPHDGEGSAGIMQLLALPQILIYPAPTSLGGAEASRVQMRVNARHTGDPAHDTEDGGDFSGGNLRLDYILPSANLNFVAAGVFWPEIADPLSSLTAGAEHPASSDHRLVWIDVAN